MKIEAEAGSQCLTTYDMTLIDKKDKANLVTDRGGP
jgi:hypothetical protein